MTLNRRVQKVVIGIVVKAKLVPSKGQTASYKGNSLERTGITDLMTKGRKNLVAICTIALAIASGGCTWNRDSSDERTREERTRDEVAKATERAKPALEDAGRKIGKAAAEAANQAEAAAEGVREGWNRGKSHLVNVNEAAESELTELPGIGRRDARRVVDARPYRSKHELVSKGVISEEEYERIRDRVTVK